MQFVFPSRSFPPVPREGRLAGSALSTMLLFACALGAYTIFIMHAALALVLSLALFRADGANAVALYSRDCWDRASHRSITIHSNHESNSLKGLNGRRSEVNFVLQCSKNKVYSTDFLSIHPYRAHLVYMLAVPSTAALELNFYPQSDFSLLP